MPNVTRLPKPANDRLLQLHIELTWIKPAIWRRVAVPERITLSKLHQVIQAVMGWSDTHLHEFEIAGESYGIPDPDWGPPVVSEQRKTLTKVLYGSKAFRYVYDFGDNWEHRIKIERLLPAIACPHVLYCIDGANASPPEDVGVHRVTRIFWTRLPTPNIPNTWTCSTGTAIPSIPRHLTATTSISV